MYFNKIEHPVNFRFADSAEAGPGSLVAADRKFRRQVSDLGADVFRLRVDRGKAGSPPTQAELEPRLEGKSDYALELRGDGGWVFRDGLGKAVLETEAGRGFGVCDDKWLMCLEHASAMRFYGMGEKALAFERSAVRTKFWNTDVFADFDIDAVRWKRPDPLYVSVPYLLTVRGNRAVGLLIHHAGAAFMSTNPPVSIAQQQQAESASSNFYVGAPSGPAEIYLIGGADAAEVTRKLQRLVGTTPLPPLWALGHHQCRWGYESYKQLDELDRKFDEHKIPNDGLWLDIEYMDGYRVFTFASKNWKDPPKQIGKLTERGRKVLAILDPGVKKDPGYGVYDDGLKQDVFCKTAEGEPYVGFVWPGATVFPDFSIARAREWWAGYVKAFAQTGMSGAWLDMNDPAVGFAELDEMRFDDGKQPHETFHNQYASAMARASREGLLAARPDERPFLLTRSAFTGTARYAAVWTGDNFSNAHHLRNAIPMTLNLALSGIPFNGPDVPGFADDPSPQLAIAWYKAGFLFPFLRNHSMKGGRFQEPWTFGSAATRIIRRYIRLRYKLLPYLYNLFIDQHEQGEAILRPLFYDFKSTSRLPLDRIDDQMMVGPAIMQAPVLEPGETSRRLTLPAGEWFDATAGRWLDGGRTLQVKAADAETPLYLRAGSIVPMLVGEPKDQHSDLRRIEAHVVLRAARGSASLDYRADDGGTFAYERGERSRLRLKATARNGKLTIKVESFDAGWEPIEVRFVLYDAFDEVTLEHEGTKQPLKLRKHKWTFTGAGLQTSVTSPTTLS